MDRISALRNVEDALREFESGEVDLATAERRVLAVLRTYATEFEGEDGDLAAYRAAGDDRVAGVVVVAESAPAAHDRVLELLAESERQGDAVDETPTRPDGVAFEVERLG
ncbi:hypothetical protein ACFO0N_16195 [Halobium salinum]|uniref:Uncharacterized protein n=1 Tax=Halobium salinum TaxID=1364940 RepID=A0ABD5PFR2_9EURY|nr:hypothetical protein [Halobium salinum]